MPVAMLRSAKRNGAVFINVTACLYIDSNLLFLFPSVQFLSHFLL